MKHPSLSSIFLVFAVAAANHSFASDSLNPFPRNVRLSPSDKIDLLRAYRFDRQNPSLSTGITPVLAVFYDVNGDGSTDALVSSTTERLPSGEFIWRLYLNETNGWAAARHSYSDNRVSFPDLVIAGTNDFIGFTQHWSGNPALLIYPGFAPGGYSGQIAWDMNRSRPVHLPVEELRDDGVPDPSLTPRLSSPDQEDPSPTGYAERTRILVDLNNDGETDMLLSSDIGMDVYYRHGDLFYQVGAIDNDLSCFAFEYDYGHPGANGRFTARIWTYSPGGGWIGQLGYFRVGEREISPFCGMEIYPGDGGTEIGRKLFSAVFETESEIPYTIQRSSTSADGVVHWSSKN